MISLYIIFKSTFLFLCPLLGLRGESEFRGHVQSIFYALHMAIRGDTHTEIVVFSGRTTKVLPPPPSLA